MPTPFDQRRLTVLAIGGHGLSSPYANDLADERRRIDALCGALTQLADQDRRLLVVHGNGPQVGRLLHEGIADLDVHTAQTQGELGYLLCQALPAPNAALVTRVVVTDDPGPPVKKIGPVLSAPPAGQASAEVEGGWRVLVPSPRPAKVVETDLIRTMLASHHVVAGGGGGVPLTQQGERIDAVIDKDWVAALLGIALGAELIAFATDVPFAYRDFGSKTRRALKMLDVPRGRRLLDAGEFEPGSMAPKVASALEFVGATGGRACICAVPDLVDAIDGVAGTQIS